MKRQATDIAELMGLLEERAFRRSEDENIPWADRERFFVFGKSVYCLKRELEDAVKAAGEID